MYSPKYPDEQKYFDFLWQISLGDVETTEGTLSGSEVLSGNLAVKFFNRSNVGTSYLKLVWSMSTPTATMSKPQFYTALRYIYMIQNGDTPVTTERMLSGRHLNIGLPRFSGIQLPVYYPTVPAAAEKGTRTLNSNSNSCVTTALPSPPAVANKATAYVITAVEYGNYHKLFISYDRDRDGYLTVQESMAVFHMSGLHTDLLRQIFQLVDCDKDSRINSKEFAIAFRLILCNMKWGLPIPTNGLPLMLATFLANAPNITDSCTPNQSFSNPASHTAYNLKSISSKSGYINPEDGIMLVRKEALIRGLCNLPLSSEGINIKYWKERGNIYDIIPRENNFKEVKFSFLRDERYAVLLYQWITPWNRLALYMNDVRNPLLCEWIWIDIICLDQNSENKMRTMINSDYIYKHASEYRIMEVSSLSRGWIVYELSNIQRTKVTSIVFIH